MRLADWAGNVSTAGIGAFGTHWTHETGVKILQRILVDWRPILSEHMHQLSEVLGRHPCEIGRNLRRANGLSLRETPSGRCPGRGMLGRGVYLSD